MTSVFIDDDDIVSVIRGVQDRLHLPPGCRLTGLVCILETSDPDGVRITTNEFGISRYAQWVSGIMLDAFGVTDDEGRHFN